MLRHVLLPSSTCASVTRRYRETYGIRGPESSGHWSRFRQQETEPGQNPRLPALRPARSAHARGYDFRRGRRPFHGVWRHDAGAKGMREEAACAWGGRRAPLEADAIHQKVTGDRSQAERWLPGGGGGAVPAGTVSTCWGHEHAIRAEAVDPDGAGEDDGLLRRRERKCNDWTMRSFRGK